MATFSEDTAVVGGGNTTAKNALAVTFDQDLAGIPLLEAYSDISPSLAVTPSVTNDDALFYAPGATPTDSSIIAMATFEHAVNSAPADWPTLAAFGGTPYPPIGENYARKLYGEDSVLQLLPDAQPAPTAGDILAFNLAMRTGPNTPTTANAMAGYVTCRFVYTGATAPNLTFLGNSGTDAVPVWDAIAGQQVSDNGDTDGTLIFSNTNPNLAAPVLTRPASGDAYSGAIVVTGTGV